MSTEKRSIGTLAKPSDLRVRGYCVTWDAYEMGHEFERVDPAAFTRSLESPDDIALLWNHDTGKPLARVRAGNLRLFADSTGLGFEATLADTQSAREAVELVKSGVVSQCSFGFIVRKERYDKDEKGRSVRVILDAELMEVSIVTFPANPSTSVEARSEVQRVFKRIHLQPPM